jgi:hypothetical protein
MIGSSGSIGFATKYSWWKFDYESYCSGTSFDGMSSYEVEANASIWKNFCS